MRYFFLTTFFILSQFQTVFGQGEPDIRLYSPAIQPDSNEVKQDTVLKKGFDLDFSKQDGSVNVDCDSRIKSLTAFTGTARDGQNSVKMAGYRLQIFYDQEKNNVNQKKADYLARYKDEPAYINYKAPNFRLRVGDFRTRLQAEQYMNEIKLDWPDAIVVEDDIELPRLDVD